MKYEKDCLFVTKEPWLLRAVAGVREIDNFAWSLMLEAPPRLVVRIFRGNKMPNKDALFNEFAAALQFPYYFGQNWAAVDECIADLEWLPAPGYLLIIRDCDQVLSKSKSEEFKIFINVLTAACEAWSKPVAQGESWDRPAKPFHVLLHSLPSEAAKLEARLQTMGVSLPEISADWPSFA